MKGFITLEAIDQVGYHALCTMKEWADQNFGSVMHAMEALDADGGGSLSFPEFKKAISRYKLDLKGKLKMIFYGLSSDGEELYTEDMRFLDAWDVSGDKQRETGLLRLSKMRFT